MNVEKIREEYFPITKKIKFFDTANHSPPSIPVQEAIRNYLDDWDNLDRKGDQRTLETIESWSRLIGCNKDEACFQPNTSSGLAVVSEILRFKKGDSIIINDLENPANQIPWLAQRNKGVEIRIIRGREGYVHLEDVEKAVDDSTKAIALSQVEWMSGGRHNLREFADLIHENDGYLVVDGIQAAGALKIDVKKDKVDFYANGAYKWLLGCSGAGFLYVSKEHVANMDPQLWGYRAVEKHSLDRPYLKPTAKKYEFGEPSYLSTVGTKAAIDLMLKLGPSQIETQILKLNQRLYDGLSFLGAKIVTPEERKYRAGIVTFNTKNNLDTISTLKAEGFYISLRAAGIRVATNFFNNEQEVDKLLENVRKQGV
ncbi:aminotransferase class V-fold PLP-dependent enzyme [Candidatus Bathyarchaeota archaeon]|nr:aminotransferase class V-fold PLP-dependent enzyme [Candidatus Bathyarchaeota archaeon]